MKNREILRKIGIFSHLRDEELDKLLVLMKERECSEGSVILTQDETGDSMFLILGGRVRIVLIGEDGREVLLTTLKSGDFFGEMSLLDGQPRSASVIADAPAQLLILERDAFLDQLRKSPDIALQIMGEMSRRLRQTDEKIQDLTLLDVYGRVARALLRLAKGEGVPGPHGGLVIERRPTHQELADMIGTSRETVTRVLSDLSRRGAISMVGRRISINADMEKLKKLTLPRT